MQQYGKQALEPQQYPSYGYDVGGQQGYQQQQQLGQPQQQQASFGQRVASKNVNDYADRSSIRVPNDTPQRVQPSNPTKEKEGG